ncbi:hypothetical protein AK812_SmicGene13157 [Symbiodinium microadriaticum]|uniref:Uncharacterized protein n=1 Tax=Symbiodinium microadriaticum TaxID=2951 RepID=A0A1Q9E8U7_SYMMI|nr:hypothetical protein AK812_SmicGene13157 [Symbiodinium microadriaticum]
MRCLVRRKCLGRPALNRMGELLRSPERTVESRRGIMSLPRALSLDVTASDGEEARLLRREAFAGSSARQAWEELLKAAEGVQQPLSFKSSLRQCKDKLHHLANTQRALREVPVILLGGLLLGYRS